MKACIISLSALQLGKRLRTFSNLPKYPQLECDGMKVQTQIHVIVNPFDGPLHYTLVPESLCHLNNLKPKLGKL